MTNRQLKTMHSVVRGRVFRRTQEEFGSRCPKLWKTIVDAIDEYWDLLCKSIQDLHENPGCDLSDVAKTMMSSLWDYVLHMISLCNHIDQGHPPLRAVLPLGDGLCLRAARQWNGDGSWEFRNAA